MEEKMLSDKLSTLKNIKIKLKTTNRALNALLSELKDAEEETFYSEVRTIRDSNIDTILAINDLELRTHAKKKE